jgi:formylglycine-generating enzyme required for sulfatase activity
MHDNVSEWVRDWEPFQNKPNAGEAQDNILAMQMAGLQDPYNNVGHNKPGFNLDKAIHRKTFKGGNYKQSAETLTKNQQANFAHPNFMSDTIGFRVVEKDSSLDFSAVQLSPDHGSL